MAGLRVLVMGSYRPQEGQRETARDAGKRFRETAFALGKGLAENGHDLLIGWGYINYASQLGVRDQGGRKVTRHPKSHSYWETADFHALRGFLSVLRQYPDPQGRKRVFLETEGKSDDFPDALPFGSISLLARMRDAPLQRYRAEATESLASDWIAEHAIDIREAPYAAAIDITHRGDVNTTAMREEILKRLASKADAVFILGEGKATQSAAKIADPNVLLVLAPFCAEGAFTVSEEAYQQSDKLRAEWADLSTVTHGNCIAMAHGAGRRLARLLRAAGDSGPAIPIQSPAFQLSSGIVVAGWIVVAVFVGKAAQVKAASWQGIFFLEVLGLVVFALLMRLELSILFKSRRSPLKIFAGVVFAAMLSLVPTIGFMDNLLTFLTPPGAPVANGSASRPAAP